jgi:hypothetical protein
MATVKISELPALTGANTAATDVIPIVDVSGNITNKITREEFFKNIQSNVGIGTSSPGFALDVQGATDPIIRVRSTGTTSADDSLFRMQIGGTTANNIIQFGDSADTDAGYISYDHASDYLAVGVNAAERMRITSSGNVGIGETSPGVILHTKTSTATVTGRFESTSGSNASTIDFVNPLSSTNQTRVGSLGDRFGVLVGGSERLSVTSGGLVGVGTTSPQTNLEISSASSSIIRLTNTTNSTAGAAVYDFGALEFFTGDTSTPGTRVTAKIAAEADTASAAPGGELVFYSAATASSATERMRIDSSGNVGIGTTSPQVPLDVAGAAEFGGVIYRNQPAQTSKAAAATLTIAELLTGIIQYTGGAATLTLPTGTLIEGGTPASFPTNMSFDFSVINTGSGTATLGTATGLTLVGAMTVTAGASGMFRVRKTATNTYTVYRIA